MDKSEQLIMVVRRDILFGDDYFQGFRLPGEVDYESRILERFEYIPRGKAEEDPAYQQPIGYALLVNPALRRVFAYRRSSRDADYPEKRLQGKWSWGVGGHIEKSDVAGGNPIRESMLREIREEIAPLPLSAPRVLGYINDDRDAVGKVHFGILYVVETDAEAVRPVSPEIASGSLRSLEELDGICADPDLTVEEWSLISYPPLKDYLTGATRE